MLHNLSKVEFKPMARFTIDDANALTELYNRLIDAVPYSETSDLLQIKPTMSLNDIACLIVDARIALSELLDI
jgi:hypothetical protein